MPETGYNETFDSQGNVIESTPFEISDNQLQLRALDKECNAYHVLARQALANWDTLTLSQKDKVLKFLLGYYLSSAHQLHYYQV